MWMVYHLHMLSIPVQQSNVGLWQGQSQDSTVETGAVVSSVAQSGKLDGGLGLEAHLRLLGAWTVLCSQMRGSSLPTPRAFSPSAHMLANALHLGTTSE